MRPTREMRPRPILSLGLGGAIGGGTSGTDPFAQYVLVIEGGRDTVSAHGDLGSTEDIDPTDGNVHTGMLDDDCTITLLAPDTTRSPSVSTIELYLTEDGTGGWTPTFAASGGTIEWPGGSAPAHDTTAATLTRYVFETVDDGVTWYGLQVGSGGSGSISITDGSTTVDPLTSLTVDGTGLADVSVTDDTGGAGTLTVDVTLTEAAVQAVGHYEVMMDGASPPEPLENGSGTDWLYVWVYP